MIETNRRPGALAGASGADSWKGLRRQPTHFGVLRQDGPASETLAIGEILGYPERLSDLGRLVLVWFAGRLRHRPLVICERRTLWSCHREVFR